MSSRRSPCPFNCGWCGPNQPHVCKKCGKFNDHRSINCNETTVSPTLKCSPCPQNKQKFATGSVPRSANCSTQSKSLTSLSNYSGLWTFSSPLQVPPPQVPALQVPSPQVHSRIIPGHTDVKNSALLILIQKEGKTYVSVHFDTICNRKIIIPGGDNNPGEDPIDASKREASEEQGFHTDGKVTLINEYATVIKKGPRRGKSITFYVCITEATHQNFDWKSATTPNESTNSCVIPKIFRGKGCYFPLGGNNSHIYAVEVNTLLASEDFYGPHKYVLKKAKNNHLF